LPSTTARNESALSIQPQNREPSKISLLEFLANGFDLGLGPSIAAAADIEIWAEPEAITNARFTQD